MRGGRAPTNIGSCAAALRQVPSGCCASLPSERTNTRWRCTLSASIATAPAAHESIAPAASPAGWFARLSVASRSDQSRASRPGTTGSPPARGMAEYGSHSAVALIGTASQTQYAARAPTTRRRGIRTSPTKSTARLIARVSRARLDSARLLILEAPQKVPQLADIPLGKLALAAEMRHERGDAPAEQAIEEALALFRQPLLACKQRRVDESPSVLLRADGPLLQEAAQQCLDGRLLPVALLRERCRHVFRCRRAALPQHGEDDGLRLADRLGCLHRYGLTACRWAPWRCGSGPLSNSLPKSCPRLPRRTARSAASSCWCATTRTAPGYSGHYRCPSSRSILLHS